MRTDSARLRLPTVLPMRPRCKAEPLDFDSWNDHDDVAAPRSDQLTTAAMVGDDGSRYDQTWQEHVPHSGRRPAEKGIASFRGSMVDAFGNEIVFESTLERAAANILMADRRTTSLEAQVGPVHHVDDDGKERRPIFDFVATDDNGRTTAIAIKPGRKRVSSGIDATIAAVRGQRPDFTDQTAVWTEDDLPRFAEHNAGLILRSRRIRNEEDVAALTKMASHLRGIVPIGYFLRSFRADGRGFTAVVNLIDDGVLVPVDRGRIAPGLRVRPAA